MKKAILALATFLFTMNASANDNMAASMKVVGEQFKVLAGAIQSQSFTQIEYESVELMQSAIADAALEYPDTATDDAAKVKYSRWMAELMKMAITLEVQVEVILEQETQDMADVTQTLMAMNDLRKEAHTIFKAE